MMDKKEFYNNCEKCGRPFPKARPCECNYYDGCLTEYPNTMLGCIKKGADPCKAKAVIPAVTVETTDGITNLANCFVHVTSINTTFYIDDKHRPMIIWAGEVELDTPVVESADEFYEIVEENALGLRAQHALFRAREEATGGEIITDIYYDKNGKPFMAGTYYELRERV